MPIFTNIAGAFRLLTDITVNAGGVLHELDTVHANENGLLHEIHSAWKAPSTLKWSNGATGLSITTNMGYSVPVYTECDICQGTKVTVRGKHMRVFTSVETMLNIYIYIS